MQETASGVLRSLARRGRLRAALACGGEVSASTAEAADGHMSSDGRGDDLTTVQARDSVFFAQVDLQNAPDDTVLKAVRTVVEAQRTDPGLVIHEGEYTTGRSRVCFTLSNNDLWSIGTYKGDST
jgi:hypothetical protein